MMKKNSIRYIQNRYCKIVDEANEAFVVAKSIVEENKKLKDLLKEIKIAVMFDKDLIDKIDDVL